MRAPYKGSHRHMSVSWAMQQVAQQGSNLNVFMLVLPLLASYQTYQVRAATCNLSDL